MADTSLLGNRPRDVRSDTRRVIRERPDRTTYRPRRRSSIGESLALRWGVRFIGSRLRPKVIAEAADTTVNNATDTIVGPAWGMWGPYYGDDRRGEIIYIDSNHDVVRRSTNTGGTAWASSAAVEGGTAIKLACWYDQETPGLAITAQKIHVAWLDSANGVLNGGSIRYANCDMNNGGTGGTWSTPVVIETGFTLSGSNEKYRVFVTESRNGNIYVGFVDSNNGVSRFYRSTNAGVSFGTRDTGVWESNAADYTQGVTCNTGDGADCAVIFRDISAAALSIKVYDDSANAWTETAITTVSSMYDSYPPESDKTADVKTIRSSGKAFLAACTEVDQSTGDCETFLLDINSVSSPTITAKTNLYTNVGESGIVALYVDQRTDEIYACYISGGTWESSTVLSWKKSSDLGATWSSATAYNSSTGDIRLVQAGASGASGYFQPCWWRSDVQDLFVNLDNDVIFAGDVLIEGSYDPDAEVPYRVGDIGPFWINETTGVVVGSDSAFDMSAYRTTDGGSNWSKSVLEAGTVIRINAWFDMQAPGDTGTLVHCVWEDAATTNLRFAQFDVSAGTWSTPVTIGTGLSGGSSSPFVVKTAAGGFVAGVQSSSGSGTWKSSDGASWSSITTLIEAASDVCVPIYVFGTGDANDAGVLFFDSSAHEWSIKMYDDSANTWTETSITTNASNTASYHLAGRAIRLSDGHTIFAVWNEADTSTADLTIWDITPNSIASPSKSQLADAVTNRSESIGAGVFVDPNTDDIYCSYLTGTVAGATINAVYKKSADGGASWGSEVVYGQQLEDDFRGIWAGACGVSGGRFLPVFFDDDDNDLFCNPNNAVTIDAAAGGSDIDLSGTFNVESAYEAALDVARSLSGSIEPTTDFSAALVVAKALSGALEPAVSFEGMLGVGLLLSGAIEILTAFDGNLARAVELAASLDVETLWGADLDVEGSGEVTLSGTMQIVTAWAGVLASVKSLAGSLGVVTDFSAPLSVLRSLSGGLIVNVGYDGGALVVSKSLSGDITVIVHYSGEAASVLKALTGSMLIEADFSGNLGKLRPLSGALLVETEWAAALEVTAFTGVGGISLGERSASVTLDERSAALALNEVVSR